MANTANADIFFQFTATDLTVHGTSRWCSSGDTTTSRFTLGAKVMAQILWDKLFEKGNCWTNTFEWVKGDWTFYPEWGDKVGLGVLRTLTYAGSSVRRIIS